MFYKKYFLKAYTLQNICVVKYRLLMYALFSVGFCAVLVGKAQAQVLDVAQQQDTMLEYNGCLAIIPDDGTALADKPKGGGVWGSAQAGRTSFPSRRQATGHRVFIFDPKKPAWAAYNEDGKLVKTGEASGGKSYCPDVGRSCLTPRGSFAVHAKGSRYCKSSKYPLGKGGAPMPHCMFFYRGYAIHGSPNVPKYNASHGCIRVRPDAAAWLHKHFIRMGTQVIVKKY